MSSYKPETLRKFPNLFSEDELSALKNWGEHAAALDDGLIPPISIKENIFVEVCKMSRPPETRFQRVWLRYKEAVLVEKKIFEMEQELSTLRETNNTLNEEVDRLKDDVYRFKKLWKLATQELDEHKAETDSGNKKADCNSEIKLKEDVNLLKKYETNHDNNKIDILDFKTRDQYLLFIKNGLFSLSSNEIFILFNVVDRLNLTQQELSDFYVEHERRKSRLPIGRVGGDCFIEYANTDGQ